MSKFKILHVRPFVLAAVVCALLILLLLKCNQANCPKQTCAEVDRLRGDSINLEIKIESLKKSRPTDTLNEDRVVRYLNGYRSLNELLKKTKFKDSITLTSFKLPVRIVVIPPKNEEYSSTSSDRLLDELEAAGIIKLAIPENKALERINRTDDQIKKENNAIVIRIN